jgi:hypothetical protein
VLPRHEAPLFCHCFAAAKDKICFINTSRRYVPLFSLSFLDVYETSLKVCFILHCTFRIINDAFARIHRYLRKVVCLTCISLCSTHFNKTRALVAGTKQRPENIKQPQLPVLPGPNVIKYFCLDFTNLRNKLECLSLESFSSLTRQNSSLVKKLYYEQKSFLTLALACFVLCLSLAPAF